MDLELETNQTCAHVMGLSTEVAHLYLNQANLMTSDNKRALVERMLDNGIIPSNAPSKGESSNNPAAQDGTQNEDEPAEQDGRQNEDEPAGQNGTQNEDEPAGQEGTQNED